MEYRRRKLNRKKNHDYSQDGWYFVTIGTKYQVEWFGEIVDGEMNLNRFGGIVDQCWNDISNHFPHIILDEYIIMPNHIHGILNIDWEVDVWNNNYCSIPSIGNGKYNPWQTKWAKTISSAIRGFKIGVTLYSRKELNNYEFAWHKSFHDRIIRSETEYINIKNYIINNPFKWQFRKNNK